MLIIVDQLRYRGGREIQNRLRIDTDDDGEDDQRHEDRDFAPAEILDVEQARLFKLAENDLAIEPQRIGRRQDGEIGRASCRERVCLAV